MSSRASRPPDERPGEEDANFSDMLQELRILLQGVQVLTGFLIVLPFNPGFAQINGLEKRVYLATFACCIVSLVLFSAPAAHHRLERPLIDREAFKNFATRMIVIGLVPLSLALVLATQLVVSEVLDWTASLVAAGLMALLIGAVWWLLPWVRRTRASGRPR